MSGNQVGPAPTSSMTIRSTPAALKHSSSKIENTVAGAASHIGALTAVRGIAAWWVVLYHFREIAPAWLPDGVQGFLARGHNAVDLFFILSGFVIGLNYSARFDVPSIPSTVRFYLMRLARIYPLHIFMLTLFLLNPLVIILFSTQATPGSRYDPAYFVMSVFLVQNWGFSNELAWNVPAWSISTELFAYLLFPFAVAGAGRISRGPLTTILVIGLFLGLLAFVFRINATGLGGEIERLGLLRCVLEFSVGVMLHRLLTQRPDYARFSIHAAIAGMFIYSLAFLQVPDYTVVPLSLTLLIFALAAPSGVPSRCIDFAWLRAIGTVSYATYMVHYFVRDWIKFGLVDDVGPHAWAFFGYILVTAVASVLLYRLVEVPGRRLGNRIADRAATALRPVKAGAYANGAPFDGRK